MRRQLLFLLRVLFLLAAAVTLSRCDALLSYLAGNYVLYPIVFPGDGGSR